MKNDPQFDNDHVAAALRAEADALTPAFSPELHNRVMARLETQKPEAATLAAGDRFRPQWRWPAVGVAAAIALAAGVWAVKMSTKSPVQSPEIVKVPPKEVPSLPPVKPLLDVAQKKMDEGKYAYLDRDARRFAGFVLSQLPGGRE